MRVLVFGASSTEGFWDTEGGWAARLRRHYSEIKINDWSSNAPWITNLGVSGDTVKDILERFDFETRMRLKEESKCAFIFSVGGNDSNIINGKEAFSTKEFVDNFKMLTQKAKKYSSQILIVGMTNCEEPKTTPIPWADIYVTNERRLKFEKALRSACEEQKLHHVSLFETMLAKTEKGDELFTDGLHPNNAGHQLIFELVRPELDKLLARDANH
jgi:lysophospholipase L1-like esterase